MGRVYLQKWGHAERGKEEIHKGNGLSIREVGVEE